MRRAVVVATIVGCLLALTGGLARAQAPAPASTASAAAPTPAAAGVAAADGDSTTTQRRRSAYRVSRGVTFNNPLAPSRDKKFSILRKIHGAIQHTHRGQTIKVMSWNIMYMSSVDALLDAQRRGVKLWILMDQENYTAEVPNEPWRRLKAGIRAWNARHKPKYRNHVKVCEKACRRGHVGAAHSKFFLFSKVGATRNVLIEGGNNLTLASATNQWNEVYTFVENPGVYAFADKIFQEMWRDRTPKEPWASYRDDSGTFDLYFSPEKNNYRAGDDPLEAALTNTRCTGATGGAGDLRHRTVIRAAPDVIRGHRGMRVAKLLRQRWNEGCNIRIAYTVMGKDVYRLLKAKGPRGPVPIRHVVQDFNGDKEFDRYFHLKVWTINGVMGGGTERYWALNGSSNISDYSASSDENMGVFRRRNVVLKYENHVSYWYDHPPKSRAVVRSRITGPVDPYRNIDLD
ncbi:MAG TPA: phospholipase D-like domain-containing protein [Nocardioides sp.]|nr:phospholipase D-like domain-containing protein [Nocardioides sp.]